MPEKRTGGCGDRSVKTKGVRRGEGGREEKWH